MDPKMEHIFYAFVGGMLNLRDRIEEQLLPDRALRNLPAPGRLAAISLVRRRA